MRGKLNRVAFAAHLATKGDVVVAFPEVNRGRESGPVAAGPFMGGQAPRIEIVLVAGHWPAPGQMPGNASGRIGLPDLLGDFERDGFGAVAVAGHQNPIASCGFFKGCHELHGCEGGPGISKAAEEGVLDLIGLNAQGAGEPGVASLVRGIEHVARVVASAAAQFCQ